MMKCGIRPRGAVEERIHAIAAVGGAQSFPIPLPGGEDASGMVLPIRSVRRPSEQEVAPSVTNSPFFLKT
jgi:hypothetical protein